MLREEAEILQRIHEIRDKKELEKTLPEGDWLEIPLGEEIEFEMVGGEKSSIINLIPKKEQLETFNQNGGVLSFYDRRGNLHFAPATVKTIQALKKSGFKYDMNTAVPFS